MVTIGFIGAGAMATAMVGGLCKGDLFSHYIFSARSDATLEKIKTVVPGCETTKDNAYLATKADVVVVAVKPQYFSAAVANVKPIMNSSKLVVSIMAGVTIEQLQSALGNVPIIRAMPNTPLLVNRGTTAFAANTLATPDQTQLVDDMFASLGICVIVEERLLDAVTGVSGSGPAYVAMMIESMTDGGVLMGLPRAVAAKLAANTVYGTGALVVEKNMHPALLKDTITSPAGTTIHGVRALEDGNFRGTVMKAVEASAERSKQLRSMA